MSQYYHIETGEAREIDEATHAAWAAAENPKAETWLLLPTPPAHDSATQHPPEWESGQWVIREKTAEDLAADARKIWDNAAEFLAEFSVSEAESIATSQNATVKRLVLRLSTWPGQVFSDDPHVAGGLSLLVTLGIITSTRRTEIITKTTP